MKNRQFTAAQVDKAFRSFNNNKAPGPDRLKPEIFKHLDNDTLERIAIIYEACNHLEYTPTIFTEYKITFIPKPKKKTEECSSWRPITLMNFLNKGLERCLLWNKNYNSNTKKHINHKKEPKQLYQK